MNGNLLFSYFYRDMNKISILPATPDERDWAATLLATTDPWLTLGISLEKCISTCHDPEYLVFVAHCDDEPCGVVILDPRGMAGSPYLKSITVIERYRNRQVGAALLTFSEEYFREQARHFFLCVSSFNEKARKFYENHGYEFIGALQDYIIPGASEIIMHKRI